MPTPLLAIAKRVAQLPRETVKLGAERFDSIARDSAARAIGNGGVMTIHGRRGRRRPVQLRTRYTIVGAGLDTGAVVKGVPGGPWVWIESGTRPHAIGTRGRQLLGGDNLDHPVYGPIEHPGTEGKRAWSEAVQEFSREFPLLANALAAKTIR